MLLRRSSRWYRWGVPVVLVLGLVLYLGLLRTEGIASPDRLVSLLRVARGSSCFLAPTRPQLLQPMPSEMISAAFQGEATSMYRLAEAYMADSATGVSGRQALPWLERAARAGYAGAAAELGRVYAAGHGVPADAARAAGWWLFAATRGDPRAMSCASVSYALGFGVGPDLIEAARWAILRDTASGAQTLLGPTAADFERALPATDMLAGRRRATEYREPVAPPAALDHAAGMTAADGSSFAELPGAQLHFSSLSPPRMPPAVPAELAQFAGTGIVVAAPGVVLTAAHVVRGCKVLVVRAGTAEFGGSEILAANPDFDLALLTVPGLVRRPVPVASATRLGAEVLVLGYPGRGVPSERMTATMGNISAIGGGAASDFVQFTAPIQGGNSGGPLIDRRGQIVGIAVFQRDVRRELLAGLNPSQNVNFATSPSTVYRFLSDHALVLDRRTTDAADTPQLVEQVERSVVQLRCYRPAPDQAQAPKAPPAATPQGQR